MAPRDALFVYTLGAEEAGDFPAPASASAPVIVLAPALTPTTASVLVKLNAVGQKGYKLRSLEWRVMESGAGKDTHACNVHYLSLCNDKPLQEFSKIQQPGRRQEQG